MSLIAIVFGVLLSVLGGGFFVYTGMDKVTSLIPAFFGIALIVLGVIARNERLRMHTMHGAALLGLIGFAMPAVMVVRALSQGATFEPVKHGEQCAMSALCLIFVGLCVKSFIDARVARKRKEAEAAHGS